jgi:hypothetical protein
VEDGQDTLTMPAAWLQWQNKFSKGARVGKATVTEHSVTPYFDVEAFMTLSRETRLGGAAMERIADLWERWLPLLNAREVNSGKISWLAVWLPESVEETVDETWAKSPSEGYLCNNLAQFLCMSAVQELLPEVGEGECAPAPRPVTTLGEALTSMGVPYKGEGPTLSRRYAVVTHYPYRGGCDICCLQNHCPKGQGKSENAGIVLPGYERETNDAD